MGYGRQVAVAEEAKEKVRLRPAEDVLHRIKWDPERRPEQYVVGYEDRFEGVLEMPFGEYVSIHCVVFFFFCEFSRYYLFLFQI